MSEKALAKTEKAVVSDPLVVTMDTAKFEQMQRVAQIMGAQSLIPDHLKARPWWMPKRGDMPPAAIQKVRKDMGEERFLQSWKAAEKQTIANCFRVVNQAIRWGFDPFAIIDHTYSIGDGKLAYEGKLVAAVVNTRGGLTDRLKYSFSGTGDNLTVTVSGTLAGETEPRLVTVRVGDVKTDNKMWKKDPEQKLVYNGAAKWARRHCPEVMLGVFTDDDLERIAASKPAALEIEVASSDVDAALAGKALPPSPEAIEIPPQAEPAPVEEESQEPEVAAEDEAQIDPEEEESQQPSLAFRVEVEAKEAGIGLGYLNVALRKAGLVPDSGTIDDLPDDADAEAVSAALDEAKRAAGAGQKKGK